MAIGAALKAQLLDYQRNETTEHHIYQRLAKRVQASENARILERIAADELRHYHEWKAHTGQEVAPRRVQVWKYVWISILTVLILIVPYLVFGNYFLSLACTLAASIAIIAAFTYYIGVARDEPFRRRFVEMAVLSLGVAGLSFVVGFLVRTVLGVDV